MPLNSRLRAMLDRLRWPTFRGSPKMPQQAVLDHLDELGKYAKYEEIPAILSFLTHDNAVIAATAAQTIQQIVDGCSSLEIAQLDSAIREMSEWSFEIRAGDIIRLSLGLPSVLGVLSCHRSGFIREPAVRALVEIDDGRELPFLLIRLNDWVDEVQQIAGRAVLERTRPAYAKHFVRHLPLLFRLTKQSRTDHQLFIEPIFRLLRGREYRVPLLKELDSAEPKYRRAIARLLLSSGEVDAAALVHCLHSQDTVIRLVAARQARLCLDGQLLVETLAFMKSDRFMPVRREALYGIAERLPDLAAVELDAVLFDLHPSMRETARFYLRAAGRSDFADRYRMRLHDADVNLLAATIAGLGETGNKEDALTLRKLVEHPVVRVRKAVVRAMGSLDPEQNIDLFMSLLTGVPGVAKAAGDILLKHFYLLNPKRLGAILNAATSEDSRRIVLLLINRLTWWDSAPLLVAATGLGDQRTMEHALKYLKSWRGNYKRLCIKPRPEQLSLLEEMLRRHRGQLDKETIEDVDAHILQARRAIA